MSSWSQKKESRKIGFKIYLFSKQKQWDVGKLNSFGHLIWQGSPVPLLSTMYVDFEFGLRKIKSSFWSRSRDKVTNIYFTLSIAHSLILPSPS